jgi:diguanylate cyclase (GGDEF)-like protein
MHQSLISLALLTATTLVAGFFAYIHSIKHQTYLLLWTAAWAVLGLQYAGPALAPSAAESPLQSALSHWLFALSGILFFLGAQVYAQRKAWQIPGLAVGLLFALWAGAYAAKEFSVSAIIPASLLYIGVGVVFWQESRRQETIADRLLGISFASWGVLTIALHIQNAPPELQGGSMGVVATAPSAFVATLMVMALYEDEKRRIERNMLALSNLNLATSSFVGSEIHRMLSLALDRVLSFMRLPAGALFLRHGDPQGTTSVVAVGLSDEFCQAAQKDGLDDYLVNLVARRGLLGFGDLRDISGSALEKEQAMQQLRELALKQGLRSIVAISLQAKEQAFGVLLLGTPNRRRFTPAELRILLSLGHQISMALENSYLVQGASRSLEELQVQVYTDDLTGVKNRKFLMDVLGEECRSSIPNGTSLVVIMIDLDNFKRLNDSQGHFAGDAVLQRAAEILEKVFGTEATVSRFGGDEFSVILPRCDAGTAREVSEKLQTAIRQDDLLRGSDITASIGIAEFPTHGLNPDEVMKAADTAMYKSKQLGRNRITIAK